MGMIMMSDKLPRRLNSTEKRYMSPKILSFIGIRLNEPEIVKKYAWNY